ncbi:hypothetical protein L873DRAFT_1772706 [Choiromyces venosus 120613-1]|uniref:VIT-domain-containing protein n=1 Tax=Choiromyces venosus 120613-1 TaxID=1336337 RepID=A0A3N4JGZ4_9PEZI|nr:hypothetical protein L873DRAFT_1772706 [Choiromyces venosus 120613-1]
MAYPSSGIYFFPEDDVPPPNDPLHNLRPSAPPFVPSVGPFNLNNFNAIPTSDNRQWPAAIYANHLPQPPLVRHQVFLPLMQVSYHCQILATTARTTLMQTFYHPGNQPISKATYTFPLYANCSVVTFVCKVGESKVITGIVKPKDVAKQTYDSAVSSGQTAGLLEYNTPDVFTTSIGNIPAGVKVKVEMEYILELPHDAEVDGIRFTVPLSIAPRYGPPPPGAFGQNGPEISMDKNLRMEIEITMGEAIRSVESPSHPTSVQLGQHGKGKGKANDQEHDPKKALVTLSQSSAELLKDFVLFITTVTPSFISTPQALLETHPTISGHQALKVTLVPRFKMPGTETPEKTEIVFLVDRSGSMIDTIGDVKSALRVFLKSLPVGCFFNIISFGTNSTSLWERSRAYTEETLKIASEHIETFDSSYGGTELLPPLMQAISRRQSEPGMNTEIMVLTDGEIWRLPELLDYIQQVRKQSSGAIRLFSLGVGNRVSHALVEGMARAGGGYSQIVPSGELGGGMLANGLEAKVVRMLNSALTDHIEKYKLHVLHEEGDEEDSQSEDEGENVGPKQQVTPAHPAPVQDKPPQKRSRKINLFDPTEAPRQRSLAPPPSPDVKPVSTLGDSGDSGNIFAHLKKLQGPEVIQAPFEIPPLFPYERSVVYLLIPPTTNQLKHARFVTLSATTIGGDKLSLSIPITRIEQPGETVHQLAARMLLRDLEEEKSWLHSGEYGVTAEGDAAAIKEYVQREGEEVGMRWSLASKWTSFVGIEEEILDESPIQTRTSSEKEPSELSKSESLSSDTPNKSSETSADSEDSMSIDAPTSSPVLDHMSLPRTNSPHSLLMAVESKAPRGVVKCTRVMNSGVDTMSRLLSPRDTPGPTHPLWNGPALPCSTGLGSINNPYTGISSGKGYSYPAPPGSCSGYSTSYSYPAPSSSAPPSSAPSSSPPPISPLSHSHLSFAPPTSHYSPPEIFCRSPAPALDPSLLTIDQEDITALDSVELNSVKVVWGYTNGGPPQASPRPPFNIYTLIASQKFNGSFDIADAYVVELLGSRMDSIPEACGGDKVAWVALLIAVMLQRKHAHLQDIWELVVSKIWMFVDGCEGVRVEEAKVMAEELVAAWE